MSLRSSVQACAERLLTGGEPGARARAQRGRPPPRTRTTARGIRADVRDQRARPAPAHAPPARAPRGERSRARASSSPPGGMSPAAARSSIQPESRRRSTAARLRAQQARRGGAGGAWAEELAGERRRRARDASGVGDTPGIRGLCRGSSASCARCCAPPSRARTRSCGWRAAAQEPALLTGRFWCDRHVRSTHRLSRTRETPIDRERLWTALEAFAAGAPAQI